MEEVQEFSRLRALKTCTSEYCTCEGPATCGFEEDRPETEMEAAHVSYHLEFHDFL